MMIPEPRELQGVVGANFDAQITLWQDKQHTAKFDLTGYTVEVEIDTVATLTEGDGVTVTPAEGLIAIALSAAQTADVRPTATNYRVKLTHGGVVDYPIGSPIPPADPCHIVWMRP